MVAQGLDAWLQDLPGRANEGLGFTVGFRELTCFGWGLWLLFEDGASFESPKLQTLPDPTRRQESRHVADADLDGFARVALHAVRGPLC